MRRMGEEMTQPLVRIGGVLAEDAIRELELRVPESAYELVGAPGEARRVIKSARVQARVVQRDCVVVTVGDEPPQAAAAWSLAPREPRAKLTRGQGVLVRGVVAGRGFHWQKHVDQTLAGRIELLPSERGIVLVNELPLETYLAGVITSEMSSACPIEFLRAQCITARAWLLAMTEPKHAGEPFDRCNDDCCQRYQGTDELSDVAIDAVESTRGIVLVARDAMGDDVIVDANYSKSCGGIVEIPEHVWGIQKPGLGPLVDAPESSRVRRFMPVTEATLHDYLEGDWLRDTDVYCSPSVVPEDQLGKYLGRVDEAGHYFRWRVRYSHDELLELLRQKLPEAAQMTRLTNLRVTKRGISGRATEMVIEYVDGERELSEVTVPDQYRIRQILHERFLYSSAFAMEIERDSADRLQSVALTGAGWGHGAGLCQIGALGMSLRGIDHVRIVKHYFPGAELKSMYG